MVNIVLSFLLALVTILVACSPRTDPVQEEKSVALVVPTIEVRPQEPPVDRSMDLQPAGVSGVSVKTSVDVIHLDHLQALIKNRRGRPLWVHFWATWFPPCVRDLPDVVSLHDQYGKEVDFLLISADAETKNADQVPELMAQMKISCPSKILAKNDLLETLNALDSDWNGELPMTFLYDSSGKKIQRYKGAQKIETYKEDLKSFK